MRSAAIVLVASLVFAGAAAAESSRGDTAPGWERYDQDMDRALDDAERELRKLEKRLDAFAAQSRERLEAKRRLIERKLAEMRARTNRAWDAARPDLERALEELRKALREPAPAPDVTRT